MIQIAMPLQAEGYWLRVRDGDTDVRQLFDRHYSARKNKPMVGVNANKFAGPGQSIVLRTAFGDAIFVWRAERYRQVGQYGIYCAVFRNEGPLVSSNLIREACVIAWERWPGERLFTHVNPRKVQSSNPGYCFLMAGWKRSGKSKKGLHILECQPQEAA